MLKISRLADYAMLIVDEIAKNDSKKHSATRLALVTSIPKPTVSKILKQLCDADLVTSLRGAHGGYVLKDAPYDISVAAVITAVDGAFAMTECNLVDSSCRLSEHCSLRANWQFINSKVTALLSQISIQDMQQPMIVE